MPYGSLIVIREICYRVGIQEIQQRLRFPDESRMSVILLNHAAVLLLPALIRDFNLAYQALQIVPCWNGKPSWPVPGHQFVPVAPVGMRILDVVIKDEKINVMDEVEIALPGDVVGLQNCNPALRLRFFF